MSSTRHCPSCWSALSAGARACAACGAEVTVARWRAVTWALLLIALASGSAWWLRGWLAEATSPSTESGSVPAHEEGAAQKRAPDQDGKAAVAPVPVDVGEVPAANAAPAPAAVPDSAPLEKRRLDIVARDAKARTLRRATAFPLGSGVYAVPANALNGAAELVRGEDGIVARDVALFDADGVALIVDAGADEPIELAPARDLVAGAPLYVLGEKASNGPLARCGSVDRVEGPGSIAVVVETACAERFLFDARGRAVGVAPSQAPVGASARVVVLASLPERLRAAHPTPIALLNANVFDPVGEARRERAMLYATSGEYGAALDEYLVAIELEPRLRDECARPAAACVQLALRTARLQERVAQLLPSLEHAAQQLDREPLVHYAHGLALLDEERTEEAVHALERALELSAAPDRAMNDALRAAYLHASEHARADGRPGDAVALVEGALQRYPQDAQLMKSLGFAYYESGDAARARDILARVVELDPSQERSLSAILAALTPDAARGRPGDAVEIRFDPKGGAIRSRATFDDRTDADVVIDTGATMTALPTSVAIDIGIDLRRPVRMVTVETANGKVQAPVVKLASVDLHGARVTNVEAVVLPDGEAGLSRPLIGLNFLQHFRMTLDAEHGVLRLAPKN